MPGLGIDQIQLQSCDPRPFEGYLGSAQDYVTLAERPSGAIPCRVGPDYIEGDLLEDLEARQVDLRLMSLKTGISSGILHVARDISSFGGLQLLFPLRDFALEIPLVRQYLISAKVGHHSPAHISQHEFELQKEKDK